MPEKFRGPKSQAYTMATGLLLALFLLLLCIYLLTLLEIMSIGRILFNSAWMALVLLWIIVRCKRIFHPDHTPKQRANAIILLLISSVASVCALGFLIVTNLWVFFLLMTVFYGSYVGP